MAIVLKELGKCTFSVELKEDFAAADRTISKGTYIVKKDRNHRKLLKLLENADSILSSLNHPSVPKTYGVHTGFCVTETFSGVKHLVLENSPGLDLFDSLTSRVIDPDDLVLLRDILKAVADTLAYIHSMGIIHRDIKLENIIYDPAGSISGPAIKIIDWDFADRIEKIDERIKGTDKYVSPELYEFHIGPENDVWAFGVCMYILFTERYPFNCRYEIEHSLYDKYRLKQDRIKALIENIFSHYKTRPTAAQVSNSLATLFTLDS